MWQPKPIPLFTHRQIHLPAAAAEAAARRELKIMGHFTKCPKDPPGFCWDPGRHQTEKPRLRTLRLRTSQMEKLTPLSEIQLPAHLATSPQSIPTTPRLGFKCNYLQSQWFAYNSCHFGLPPRFIGGDRCWIFHGNARRGGAGDKKLQPGLKREQEENDKLAQPLIAAAPTSCTEVSSRWHVCKA